MARVDAADQAIATDDQRAAELREMLATVDRRAIARGVAVVVVVAAILGGATWLVLAGR